MRAGAGGTAYRLDASRYAKKFPSGYARRIIKSCIEHVCAAAVDVAEV